MALENKLLNSCEFIGNIGKDPETRNSTGGTSFTTFSIAVNKRGADKDSKPLWVNVTCFGKTAEFVAKYLKMGTRVFVRGSLELQEYEGKDGKNHVSVKLIANEVLSIDKKEASETNAPATRTASATSATSSQIVDDDIPF